MQTDTSNPDDSIPTDLTNKLFVAAEQSLQFSASNAPSGQDLFIMFAATDGTKAVVATGMQPANQSAGAGVSSGDTVNTSQAGGPTTFGTNAQMIKPPSNTDPNGNGILVHLRHQPEPELHRSGPHSHRGERRGQHRLRHVLRSQ